MTRYFKNSKNELLVDPIEINHDDLISVTEDEFNVLLSEKNSLKNTRSNKEIEVLRSQAYADPITGSDRLLNDYQASLVLGSDDAETKKEAWLIRREDIKTEYPLNEE